MPAMSSSSNSSSSSAPWTADEIDDLDLGWLDFHALHPHRSDSAYRHKRLEVRRSASTYAVKPAPRVVKDTDEEETISDDELWDAVVHYQDAVSRATPTFDHHHIAIDADQPIVVAFPSDWHIGSAGTDMRRIKDDCEIIQNHPRV